MAFRPYSKEDQLNRGIDTSDMQKYKGKTLASIKAKAVEVFNRYIRERDREGDHFTCISCGNIAPIKTEKGHSNYHAGHYYPAGEYSMLKFDEQNVNGEELRCNYYRGDHLIGYRERLVKKWGLQHLARLDAIAQLNKRAPKKWSRIELIHIIKVYTEKLQQLKNGSQNKTT